MESFIGGEGRLCMFQIPFRDPRIFFGRISFPSDQERLFGQSSAVVQNLLDFIFFFSVDKVRGWRWEVRAMDGVFVIRG